MISSARAPKTGVQPTTRAVSMPACCLQRELRMGEGAVADLQAEQQRAQGDGRLAPRGRDYDGAGGGVKDALQLLHAPGDELSFNLRRG